MEKIRSGQPFLYRKEGYNSTVMDIRLKQNVRGDILNCALKKAIIRYPYFASKLVEKDGDYYIADNSDISMIAVKNKFHPLGSISAGYHLIEVSYQERHIYVAFHHALCDGRGVKPFVETLVYYYFCILKQKVFVADTIQKADSPLYDDETAEPFRYEKYAVDDFLPPHIDKDGFALPEYKNQRDDTGRMELEIDSQSYMNYAKSVNATPAILLSYLFSKALSMNNDTLDKPIVTSMASDMRAELGVPHTYKNCVRSMYLPFEKEDEAAPAEAVCTRFRETIKSQREVNYVRSTANSFIALSDKLDTLPNLEEKRQFMSFFDTMTINTYVVSYLGSFDFGECNDFIDAIHFYSGGIRGITINMDYSPGKFNVDIIYNVDADKYTNTFLALLDEAGIVYSKREGLELSTMKDRAYRTASYQAERLLV